MATKKKATSTKSKQPAAEPAEITITYDLFDLPTAQHKAGLAGLILQMEFLNDPKQEEPIFDYKIEGGTTVIVTFNRNNIQQLFDAVYDARHIEAKTENKWQGAKELRVDQTAEGKKLFVYTVVQPKGNVLCHYYSDGDAPNSAWISLWRRMLWEIPRGRPTTRIPFNDRAEGKPCKDGESIWKQLVQVVKKRAKGEFHTDSVSSAILLGAQDKNAEQVPFTGLAEQNLLLHFWVYTSQVFVPEMVDTDGKRKFSGYVLAIPEVSDLNEFLRRYKRLLSTAAPQKRLGRPTQAIIELPQQGALDFMESLVHISRESAEQSTGGNVVRSIEFHYLIKQGNNVKTQTTGTLRSNRQILETYRAICRTYEHPIFIHARLLALINNERKWYACFDDFFATRAADQFLSDGNSHSLPTAFVSDCTKNFRQINNDDQLKREAMKEMGTETENPTRPLATIVRSVIRSYLDKTTQRKQSVDEGNKVEYSSTSETSKPSERSSEYLEKRRKVAEDLFLNLRSRRDQDFVDFFVASVGSTIEGLSSADYNTLSKALLNRIEENVMEENWRDVKTLAMLAATSVSWIPRKEEN